ncbi:unnamed protein product [Moneuplotes crassus]|uniref:Uncharacterized protein n=1 Tax=Euplotes crassus TaxID=5936 RepID=A0AAD1UC73_EUPCR|nr:unnamed protein product [Moneuplotes crassus]
MGSCNCTKKSAEVELEAPPHQKSDPKNKFNKDKNFEKDLASKYQLFNDCDLNDQCKKTIQELYTTARRCQIILKEYQSCHSDSYPLSLHQISKLISQIASAFKNSQFWTQYRCEHKEEARVMNAFNHLCSQVDALEQELSLITKLLRISKQRRLLKEGHKEMDSEQGTRLAIKSPQNIPSTSLERRQEAASLNLVLTFETLYKLSCNVLSQKIYHDSSENARVHNARVWYYLPQYPGLSLKFDHSNHKGCVYSKKVRKVTLPCFEGVLVITDPKSLKPFHKCVAHLSTCSSLDNLRLAALEPTEIGLYLPQIIKTCTRVQKRVSIVGFNFNETQFKKFLMGCRHHEEVDFAWCRFDIPRVPDLSTCMKGTLIKTIWFWDCA